MVFRNRAQRGITIDRRRIQRQTLTFGIGIGDWNCRQESAGVGVVWRLEERFDGTQLDNLPEVHDGDSIADVLDEPQVVGNEEVRQLERLLQIHQQIHDLCLNRNIQGRDGFVEDEERRTECESASQSNPLPLATAELVWIPFKMRRIEAHQAEQLGDAR
jgi:hypothetical protein